MISVIIPVYNAEKYIARCLDSLLAQTYTDFEAIAIDDGSADGSFAICQAYGEKDPRFHAIHQENQGVSAARNAGIDRARGDYIAFIDADDYVLPDYLEQLLQAAQTHNADIACCDFVEILADGQTPSTPRVVSQRLVQRPTDLFEDIISEREGYCACVWAKLIRINLAKKVRFQKLRFGEDHVYMFDLFCHKPVVYLSTYKGYCYAPNEGSVTVQYNAVNVTRRAEELRMHQYRLSHLPSFTKQLYFYFYHKYVQGVIGLIGSVCRSGYPQAELQLAITESEKIISNPMPYPKRILMRLKFFCASPKLYGAALRLLKK